jgi:hypothetical protein
MWHCGSATFSRLLTLCTARRTCFAQPAVYVLHSLLSSSYPVFGQQRAFNVNELSTSLSHQLFMSFILHRIYPWKLFKDVEDMIFGRLTGPEYPRSPLSRLFTSDVPQHTGPSDPVHKPPSTPSHSLPPDNAPPGPSTPATKPLPDHLQPEDVQIHRPRSVPPTLPSVITNQSTTIPEPLPEFPSGPAAAPDMLPRCYLGPPVMDEHPAPELRPPQNPPAASISTFEVAKDVTVHNSLISTVGGDFTQSVFKFDSSERTC